MLMPLIPTSSRVKIVVAIILGLFMPTFGERKVSGQLHRYFNPEPHLIHELLRASLCTFGGGRSYKQSVRLQM